MKTAKLVTSTQLVELLTKSSVDEEVYVRMDGTVHSLDPKHECKDSKQFRTVIYR